jgi:exopolysaccharide biosynthesis protein
MIGGFPQLLRAGEEVELTGSFATTRHPRTALGWREDGTLLLVVVDGRQPGYSEGMSLFELTELFRALSAVEALNLDGGGSTTLVVAGAVANRPSDREGERAVANAVLLLEAHGDECGRRPNEDLSQQSMKRY